MWILGVQALAYYGKIIIHPVPLSTLAELMQRAAVGPVPGELMLLGGVLFNGNWIALAIVTYFLDRAKHGQRSPGTAMG